MAILAVGTDLPETFIAIDSSIHRYRGLETSGLVLGNAIGSSICQISLILGLAGLIRYQFLEKKILYRDGLVLLISVLLAFVIGYNGIITPLEGLFLLLAYAIYYFILFKKEGIPPEGTQLPLITDYGKKKMAKVILILVLGLSLIIASSELVVWSAVKISELWGVRQSFVGIILIGLGTSLPELSVSIGAAVNKSEGIAVGNILGSNIYDMVIPLGIGSLISPIQVGNVIYSRDLPLLFILSVMALLFLQSKKGLQRKEALFLIFTYLAYSYWRWHVL